MSSEGMISRWRWYKNENINEIFVFLPSIRMVERAAWKVMSVRVYAWESLGLVFSRVWSQKKKEKKPLTVTYNATVLASNVKSERNCENYQEYIHQRADGVKGLS